MSASAIQFVSDTLREAMRSFFSPIWEWPRAGLAHAHVPERIGDVYARVDELHHEVRIASEKVTASVDSLQEQFAELRQLIEEQASVATGLKHELDALQRSLRDIQIRDTLPHGPLDPNPKYGLEALWPPSALHAPYHWGSQHLKVRMGDPLDSPEAIFSRDLQVANTTMAPAAVVVIFRSTSYELSKSQTRSLIRRLGADAPDEGLEWAAL